MWEGRSGWLVGGWKGEGAKWWVREVYIGLCGDEAYLGSGYGSIHMVWPIVAFWALLRMLFTVVLYSILGMFIVVTVVGRS